QPREPGPRQREERVQEWQEAREPEQAPSGRVPPGARPVAVQDRDAVGLGGVVVGRPGEIERDEVAAQEGGGGDGGRQRSEGEKGKPKREEPEVAERPRLRIEAHGRGGEVRAV